jgi:hypothetical protein
MNKLKEEGVPELMQFLVESLGSAFLKKNVGEQNLIQIQTLLLLIRDMFVFREGKKVSDICAVSTVGYLYKLMKAQSKSDTKLPESVLYLLSECVYLGLHNKTEQFINIFSMDHTDTLVELLHKIGDEFLLHFYCLAGIESIDQKFHDFSKYHLMLNNKQPMILPNHYIRNELNKHKIVFRPMLKLIEKLDFSSENKFIAFLCQFLTLWEKVGCPEVTLPEAL